MTSNISNIKLWEDNPLKTNAPCVVKIEFNFPCRWTILEIKDLLKIISLWIEGEERKYPQEEGFKGRWLLFDEIKKVFMSESIQKRTRSVER